MHAAVLIQTAFDLGINVIDTAELYPCDGQTFGCLGKQAEIMIGQALKRIQIQNDKFDRDDIIIISKMWPQIYLLCVNCVCVEQYCSCSFFGLYYVLCFTAAV